MYKVTCRKCGGTGNIPCYRYQDGGVCYDCGGIGYRMQKTKPINLTSFRVTAVVKPGWEDAGKRDGVNVNARNERDAIKRARLHPDCYDTDTIEVISI